MDWIFLLFLVPALVVPIVLLWGFAGCGLDLKGSGPSKQESAPSKLTAKAIGTDRIELEWQNNAVGQATSFMVERLDPGGWNPIAPSHPASPFEDGGRNDGTDHTYRVTATLFSGSYNSDPSNDATATTHPNAPSNLILTPQTEDQIDLKWDHVTKSNKKIKFKVEHRPIAGGSFATIYLGPDKTFPHQGPPLSEGTDHEYRVTAIVVDGHVNSMPNQDVPSTAFATGSAKTWGVAFEAAPTTDQPPNGPSLEGFCLIQRISKTLLKKSGTKVKITLRGSSSTTRNLTIKRIYISQVDTSRKRWDSAADIKEVASGVVLPVIPSPDPTGTTLGPILYTIPLVPQDLLIAFDISNVAGQGNVRSVLLPGTGTEHYFMAATEEAAAGTTQPPVGVVKPRSPGFVTGADRLYLVEKIVVL